MEMHNIENLARLYFEQYSELANRMRELQDQIDEVKRMHLPGIKAGIATVASARSDLKNAIAQNPQLFVKPRTTVFYGLKVGLQNSKGKVVYNKATLVCRRIRRLFKKAAAERLIETTEKPVADEVRKLPPADLKRLGVSIEGAGDQVLIKHAGSDIDKMIEALFKDFDDGDQGESVAA